MTAIKVQMQTTAITAVSEQQGSIPNCSPPHCPGFNRLKKEKGKKEKASALILLQAKTIRIAGSREPWQAKLSHHWSHRVSVCVSPWPGCFTSYGQFPCNFSFQQFLIRLLSSYYKCCWGWMATRKVLEKTGTVVWCEKEEVVVEATGLLDCLQSLVRLS